MYIVLLWRRCDMDDVMFAHSEPKIQMPLQRVTSLRRRAQANAPAAS